MRHGRVASRERDESNTGIKTLLPFLKIITEERDLENFQGLMVALDACYCLHKAISIGLSRFGDDRRCHSLQYVAQYPDGTSIRTLEAKTQFLRRPFQFSVKEVFRMRAEYFGFKMKVLAI